MYEEPCTGLLPKLLIGDSIRLKQVLVNLTKNALKSSYGKPVTIRASFDLSQELLKVHIIDQGCGILPSEMQKLFSLFGRLERTEKENIEGIEMGGLTICKRIVDHCGGEINCHSSGENKGSIFIFSMKMRLQ